MIYYLTFSVYAKIELDIREIYNKQLYSMEIQDVSNSQIFTDSDTDSDEKVESKIELESTLIIGKAGIGKSTYLVENYSEVEYLRTAFTGIAAARIEAKTISSLFALGPACDRSVTLSANIMYKQKTHLILREKKGIVIDEYYTLPREVMYKVNEILQIMRNNTLPFGGMHLVLIGDNRQTASIGESFVGSTLYKTLKFNKIVLPYHDKMRLTKSYMKFCNQFRNSKITVKEMIKLLADERFAKEEVPGYTVYHQNKYVDQRNKDEMAKMTTEVIGTFYKTEYRKGCPIAITNNGPDVFNGMIGKLLGFDEKTKELEIEFDDYILETQIKGVKFVPAFSMTIHKAQCATFPGINLYLDSGKMSQNRKDSIRLIYTALTRVRTFKKCCIGWI
jgi:hypothetical protein